MKIFLTKQSRNHTASDMLLHLGEKKALHLFQEAAATVPAYKDFLHKEHVNPKKIRTIHDFTTYVPPIDKKNYLSQYPLKDLCFDGDIFHNRIISVSSGSSGVPFYWPRGEVQDYEGTVMHTEIYDKIFQMQRKSTLLIICFSMGTWIAGSFTTLSSFGYADMGRPLNIVTPGLEKSEAISAIKNLSKNYDQVVLAGYPPFIKDIVEEGARAGIDWSHITTRLMMAGEAFSEEWRDYVLRLIHEEDPYFHTVNIYGSADAGMLGNETPLSILARRLYDNDATLREEVFGTNILPSLVQYDPTKRFFEKVGNELVFTANAGIPLLRYNIKDTGTVFTFEELLSPIGEEIIAEATNNRIRIADWQKPFVSLNGRKDFSVTIYAVNIYPENIKAALIAEELRRHVTGRFTMATKNFSDMDQYFDVNVELADGAKKSAVLQKQVEGTILASLLKMNAEFRKLHAVIGEKALPHVHLLAFEDPKHFVNGVKHRWVKKG